MTLEDRPEIATFHASGYPLSHLLGCPTLRDTRIAWRLYGARHHRAVVVRPRGAPPMF